jgi:drug/metabolite transporter (DMT)-like permease
MSALLFPIGAAITHALGILFDRGMMTRREVGHRQYTILLFLGAFTWSTLAALALGGFLDLSLPGRIIWLTLGVILIAALYNPFYYQGIEKQHAEEFEPILMLTPLAAIIAAGIVFPSERNPQILGAALIASLALAFPYLGRRRWSWSIYDWRLLLYVGLAAVEVLLIKEILVFIHPAALYSVRTAGVLIALAFFYTFVRPISWEKVGKGEVRSVLLIATLPTLQVILTYYAIAHLGIVLSMLVFMIYPIAVYSGAAIFLKERLHWRNVLSGAVILAAVLFAVTR